MSQSFAIYASASSPVGPPPVTSVRRVAAFGATDTGQHYEGNEDAFLSLPDLGLFAVADGVGGAPCGEVASKMAVDSVREMFENADTTWPWGAEEAPCRTLGVGLVKASLQRAHSRILAAGRKDAEKKGMCTTFAGILTLEDRVVIAHVGDSRVYRFRQRQLDLLTEDHSLLNECIRRGAWDPAKADDFPNGNLITRAVGVSEELEVDTRFDTPLPGDVYLICSDGLHGMLRHPDLASILLKHADPTQAVTRLIEAANDRGGHDNITAVVVRLVETGVHP